MKSRKIVREVSKTALVYKQDMYDITVKPTSVVVKGRNLDNSY